jgi:hypothetical protein
MSEQITLRVRPGETVRFPNRCVACGRPATERLPLRARRGQLTRALDAPLCAECARQAARRSGREEQLLRTGRLAAAAVALALPALVVLLAGGAWWWRAALGLIAGISGAAVVWWAFRRRAEAAQLPETRAVREAARIVDFTWRDMTLDLADESLAAAVVELNSVAESDVTPLQEETTAYTDSVE